MTYMKISNSSVTSLTTLGLFLSLLKGNIGPGCLSLPHAFTLAPFPIVIPSFIIIAWLAIINSLKLSRLAKQGETYQDCGNRMLGARGGTIVMLSVSLQQLGVCTVYFAFVADNVSKVSSAVV